MKTATMRDLRYDYGKLEPWIKAGETIQITRHARPVFNIVPPKKATRKKLVHPDYEARLKRIWGDRVFSAAEVEEMRAAETGEP
jgi:antitoxin (DNA-binding transcriptional repressor) of toxin-antitoxin stability system